MSASLATKPEDGYPKTLRHPNYAPAVLGRGDTAGQPARFPPVTVHEAAQEDYFRAKGYTPAGSNFAYQGAVEAADIPGGGGLEWPKWHAGANRSAKDQADWDRAEAEAPAAQARAAAQKAAEEQAKLAADPKHMQVKLNQTLDTLATGQAQLAQGQAQIATALTGLADALATLATAQPAEQPARRPGRPRKAEVEETGDAAE